MPVRRGHVAPQNTFLGIIIRKFEGQSKCRFRLFQKSMTTAGTFYFYNCNFYLFLFPSFIFVKSKS